MIKVFVFCVLWIVASIAATTIWVRYIITKHAESAGRDPEYLEFEIQQEALTGIRDDLNNPNKKERNEFLIGMAIAMAMTLLWPITTPVMLWAGSKHADTICKVFGWGD